VLGLPLWVLGIVAWYVPYMAPRVVLRFHRPAYEALATVKLVSALIAFPLVFAAWLALLGHFAGPWWAVAAALLLPLAGLATLRWREHWRAFRHDLGFVWQAWRHKQLAEALRARRRELADAIDRVADEWEAETHRRIPERSGRRP
jgi:hypothetical protein